MTVNETRDSSTSPELVTGPHTLAAEEVAARLDVRSNFGLTSEEARQRRVQSDRIVARSTTAVGVVFFGQFKSILILILIGAALLAAPIGNAKDAVIILAVVVINAVVAFHQEYRADRALLP